MAVEIYFWPPKLDGTIGHAAIMVDGGSPAGRVYLSAWPGELLAILFGNAAFNEYNDDVSSEGKRNPEVVRLTKLDETAIKAQIQKIKGAGKYAFAAFNCASQASLCLDAGVPYRLLRHGMEILAGPTGVPFQTSVIHTPWNLWLYAKSLTVKYA